MRGSRLRVGCAFLIVVYSNSAIASFKINKRFEYYDIFPKNKYEIKK